MTTLAQRAAGWQNPPWWYAFVALPWILMLAWTATEVRRDRAIASREQTAQGTITGHDPGNHDSYEYTYVVGGRTYRAWEIPYRIEWRMGEQVVVYYDPRDPAVSSLVEFAERGDQEAGPVPVLLLGVAGVVAFIYFQRRRARRAGLPDERA